jgi:hypothetical protein
MPLLDHSQRAVEQRGPWATFHSFWCRDIVAYLHRTLPRPRFFGLTEIHLGQNVAADVAEYDSGVVVALEGNGDEGGVAVATWAPPAATLTVDAVFPDEIEVRVMDSRDGATLVAVIELVSPSNKDRDSARASFAAKCAAYLQRGIGVVVIDLIAERRHNLHNDLMGLLYHPASTRMSEEVRRYATSYRPVQRQGHDQIDVWVAALTVGQPLPTLPLGLRGLGCVPLDLEASYTPTRELIGI